MVAVSWGRRQSSPVSVAGATGDRLFGVAVGLGIDRIWGDPVDSAHPVAWFGSTMVRLERRWWADRRPAGAGFAGVGIGAAVAAGFVLRTRGALWSTAAATALCSAGRSLGTSAMAVSEALQSGDLPGARRQVQAIVGRDVDRLDEAGVARAAVESVAENTVDAVVAPALWGALGGAPGVLGHRAVNTLDAMVGYRSERYRNFGWASAKLDDVANWLPARLTAAVVAGCRPVAAGTVWRAVRDQAPAHPSPNGGVAEAAFAAALGIRLGGPTSYRGSVEDRPVLGYGRPPAPPDIARAVQLCAEVTFAVGLVCSVGSTVLESDRPTPIRRSGGRL